MTQGSNDQSVSVLIHRNRRKYQDFLNVPENAIPRPYHENMRGRGQEQFPIKLFKILHDSDAGGYSSIISWQSHGRTFKIHNSKLFEEKIMRKYFITRNLDSFKRQLHVYGFQKIKKRSTDHGAYFHELFLSNRFDLCKHVTRCAKPSSSPILVVPDFYKLPALAPNSTSTDLQSSSNSDATKMSPKTELREALRVQNFHRMLFGNVIIQLHGYN